MNLELLEKYLQLKADEDLIKLQKEDIARQIKEELNQCDDGKYADDNYDAKIVMKTTFKYKDETAIIEYLKANYSGVFVQEKIDTTGLNTELKKGTALADGLQGYYDKTTTDTLTVTRVSKE